tara:strand:+ start:1800 stop:2159 length:360 start_codon:yes stop_codon:yes gene_type:complete
MIPTEILIPSEINVSNITAKKGEPLNNAGETFGFVYRDDCGNDENIDISSYEFEFSITLNGCEYLTGSTITGELVKGIDLDTNKLWFNISLLSLNTGIYQYIIKIVGSNSVIKGNLKVI